MDPSNIREKTGRFRVLIIGRANAGKTTILQRVCNTRDNAQIYNSAGDKIDLEVLTASKSRELHDIHNEMVFQSNPDFVFHDPRGFEAGSESEFDKVKAFIADHSKETKISKRLHAIWYCIPMDEASRSFTAAENKFFSQCDTGSKLQSSVPVIVLFTKFDALYDVAYSQLKKEGRSRKDAKELAQKRAGETFANGTQLNKQRYLQDKQESDPSFHAALERYMSSPHAGAVMKGVSDTVHAYEKPVATSAKEKESSCSPAKAQLINAVVEITLNHRLHGSEVEQRFLSSEFNTTSAWGAISSYQLYHPMRRIEKEMCDDENSTLVKIVRKTYSLQEVDFEVPWSLARSVEKRMRAIALASAKRNQVKLDDSKVLESARQSCSTSVQGKTLNSSTNSSSEGNCAKLAVSWPRLKADEEARTAHCEEGREVGNVLPCCRVERWATQSCKLLAPMDTARQRQVLQF
ncbi:hypothetical protein C8R48DRAFT_766187 [Suillus tomentosus]|nr:hypothetical protein C8R48DRAFT_766187 [Suillus tomentosus]